MRTGDLVVCRTGFGEMNYVTGVYIADGPYLKDPRVYSEKSIYNKDGVRIRKDFSMQELPGTPDRLDIEPDWTLWKVAHEERDFRNLYTKVTHPNIVISAPGPFSSGAN